MNHPLFCKKFFTSTQSLQKKTFLKNDVGAMIFELALPFLEEECISKDQKSVQKKPEHDNFN